MGTSYTTAPLHTITSVDYSAAVLLESSARSSTNYIENLIRQIPGMDGPRYDPKSIKHVTPTVAEILAWRERLNDKYLDQFGHPLTWDETAPFSDAEDTSSIGDTMLSYVSATLDQCGEEAAARALLNAQRPSQADRDAVFAEVWRRQLSNRFPQILLRPHFWLPFERSLIIEEPDWRGVVLRFGSLFRFAEELAEVRRFIVQTDPRVVTVDPEAPLHDRDVLTGAWVVSECIWRLANTAMRVHLPLWGDNR